MKKLSISLAWSEAVAFVRREAALLVPLGFMLLALPSVLMSLAMPVPATPGAMAAQAIPEPGLWMLLYPVVLVGTIVGSVAVAALALTPGLSVGEAIRRGLQRLLPMLGAFLLLGLVCVLFVFLLMAFVAVAMPGAAQGFATQDFQAAAGAIVLIMLIVVPLAVYLLARFILMTPIAAAEDQGPIALLKRSWALTAGHVLRLIGFVLLFIIAVAILGAVIQILAGIAVAATLGPVEPRTASFIVMTLLAAVVNTVASVYFTSTVARAYAQLAAARVAPVPKTA